jgi:hypothetical protein
MAFSHTGESKNKEGGANRLLAAAVAGSLAFILAACESDTKSPSPNQDQTSASQDLDPTVPSAEQVMDQPQNYTEADLNALDKLSELTISDTEQAIQVSAEEALDVFRDPSQSPMSEFAEKFNLREDSIDFVDYIAVIINNLSSGDKEKVISTLSFAGLSPKHLYNLYGDSVYYSTITNSEGPSGTHSYKNGLRYGQTAVFNLSDVTSNFEGVFDMAEMSNKYGAAMAIAIVKALGTIELNQIPEYKPYKPESYILGDNIVSSDADLGNSFIKEVVYAKAADDARLVFRGAEELNNSNFKIFWLDDNGNLTDQLSVDPDTLNLNNGVYQSAGPTTFSFLNVYPYRLGVIEPYNKYLVSE